MGKKSKVILTIVSSIFSIGMISSVAGLSLNYGNEIFKNGFNSEKFSPEIFDTNTMNEEYPLVPTQANGQNAYLSAKTGPIVYWGDKITSLDWFGAERWSVDISKIIDNPHSQGDWKRTWFNWDYDRTNDVLWILTAGNWRTEHKVTQKLIAIDVRNGNDYFTNSKPTKYKQINFPGVSTDVRFLSVLKSGDVLMYGGARLNTKSEAYIYRKSTQQIEKISYDFTATLNEAVSQNNNFKWYFFNLISIGNNKNIAEFVQFPTTSNTSSFNVYGILVDDNLSQIKNEHWQKAMLIANGLDGYNNKQTTPQRDYYYLTNGLVVTILYNRLVIFDPNSTSMRVLKLTDETKWVQSWTFDASDNLYFKYRKDTSIYKINTNNIQSTENGNLLNSSTYFDISGAVKDNVNEYADNYILYNVHGYTGQIMMINSVYNDDPNFKPISPEDQIKNQYGLAVAISENKNNTNEGDMKGLLNTDKAFLKAANFEIKSDVLKNKLPSEITSEDFNYLNESFLTRNNERNESGELKYPQFVKTINDETGEINVEVNLDQIPWFVNNGQMPSDIAPKKLTFSSKDANKIKDRVSWKDVNLDYDFKNTLPSKVTDQDIKRFDPFSININSQRTTISGVSYPNKSYQIMSHDDEKGTIKIKAIFNYIPLGLEARNNNVKKYEEEKEYNIFKLGTEANLDFIGTNNDSEDIRNIPELKELSESNLLPSSFNTSDISNILKFINTDKSQGYPISKMIFDIKTDDTNGTITISGYLPSDYYPNQKNKVYTKTYTGLNKISDYTFQLNTNPNNFNKKEKRPSEITISDIYNNFLKYSGYNSSDLKLELIPNDAEGKLSLKFILNGGYPNSIGNLNGFSASEDGNYVRVDEITDFKTTSEYESQFSLIFLDDNDKSLNDIKRYTPQQINQTLNNDASHSSDIKLTIGGKEIKDTKSLAEALIKKKGSSIESIQTPPDINVYYNDPNGEITVKITYKNAINDGDLVFIERYTGFAKGNQVTTNDVFSFKTNSRLFNDNLSFKDTLPTSIKKEIESNKIDIKDFINYHSGDYVNAINQNKYKLEITTDDIHGYLTIKIVFDRSSINDERSLLSYTATYSGFMTE
ncbi:lipoprotein 17-related variable surface protein [Malacoplasma iowae]|uniref:lipoprotein 17-related variable surface protein n=1 Tax=Malacoplasma iowae TaxID=2116 RepID=UPI002A18A1F0|nr:lipoprotein 17-related variable surface protein [Malacoplasma iowae]WPL39418.1 lipoprotein 17-related variable surface protein [Malacoplasma iowae]